MKIIRVIIVAICTCIFFFHGAFWVDKYPLPILNAYVLYDSPLGMAGIAMLSVAVVAFTKIKSAQGVDYILCWLFAKSPL